MTAENAKIDAFIDRATQWREEMKALRAILLDCDLTEELKWGKPCYSASGGSIVIMQPFKAHLSLMFFKGTLLRDPEEFERRLRVDEEYREAFEALTPGRKRSYLIHFSGAKRAETRKRRIEPHDRPGPGRLVGETDKRLWRILEHYVEAGRGRADFSEVRQVGEAREAKTLGRFRLDLMIHGGDPDRVKELCMDMSAEYQAGARRHFPKASITFDRFHVVKLFNEAAELAPLPSSHRFWSPAKTRSRRPRRAGSSSRSWRSSGSDRPRDWLSNNEEPHRHGILHRRRP